MNDAPLYRDAKQPVDRRVEDLLRRMTLDEKVGQLMQLDAQGDLEDAIGRMKVGSLLHCNGKDADAAIRRALGTRLGIPVLMADDGIHGHSFWAGATIFPTQLGMACSWDPGLLERVARVTAIEMRATGLKWTFSPVLCLTRDLRWGRVGETFGEDPYLIGELACAMVKGYQGKGLDDPDAVLATAKHYAGYSETLGGRDASEANISRRYLRSYFLPPFERAAQSGCMAFMTGYQSMDGIPATANRWLLTEVLKEEWGFKGIVVTDWNNVANLVLDQKVCKDMAEAAAVAVRSGNDLMMATPQFYEGAQEAVRRGLLAEPEIDAVVRRVLSLKFSLGLFEDPGYSSEQRIREVIGCAAHRDLNLEVARASLVLLRNDGLLPLAAGAAPLRRIAVIGPNADDPIAQLGDWSLGSGQMSGGNGPQHPRSSIVTIVDGIRELAPAGCEVVHAAGCSVVSEDESGIAAAVELARGADVVVLVVGDRIEFIGETKSTATLELMGGQRALADAIARTGVPTVVVLVNSKPLVLPHSVLGAAALFEAFNPGMMGGRAVAEAIFGQLNPSGKLTISFPYHVGQQPVFYNQARGQHGSRYADLTQEPAFAFGFGLSYTRFAYADLKVLTPSVARDGTASFEVTVTNTGGREGVEIVQLYIEDLVTSSTWALKELKAFRRLTLAAGEARTVRFDVPASELSLLDAEGRRVVEPGDFRVHIGASSRPEDLVSAGFAVA
ncbi:glycoside hydrolase family 3 N-terminal domain-containing protein [Sorangium cellulosum]|uniref:beta-glucosidase n=1 Tax=Sorangium cellulosum TaxID=56 RepID=A0A150Q6T2_SORCE|nr:glycoside hydrolase family 3 N-terminal domain-containing protein [Sorangium cellulosum]KYF63691.1 glycosyl hydrolase [Sorangium cellulosum]